MSRNGGCWDRLRRLCAAQRPLVYQFGYSGYLSWRQPTWRPSPCWSTTIALSLVSVWMWNDAGPAASALPYLVRTLFLAASDRSSRCSAPAVGAAIVAGAASAEPCR